MAFGIKLTVTPQMSILE